MIGLACGGAALAAVVAIACIPDLPALPSSPDGPVAPVGPYCGDGIIQLDAGEHCDPGDAGVAPPPGCTPTCQIDCPNGLVYLDHCYYRLADQPNLLGAQTACGNEYGYVVTFESPDEWAFAVDAAPFGQREPFWIGFAGTDSTSGYTSLNPVDKPGWRPGCPGCYADVVDAAAPLPVYDGFPPNPSGCIVGDNGDPSTWFGVPCVFPQDAGVPERAHVLCERDPLGTNADPNCTSEGLCFALPASVPGKRYTYFPGPQQWDQAASYCASLAGNLLVVQTRDEREELWEALRKLEAPPTRIWLGLSFDGSANEWVWDDGVLADAPDAYPDPWASNQPLAFPPKGQGTTHAYAEDVTGAVDTQLARSGPATAAFVCEFRR